MKSKDLCAWLRQQAASCKRPRLTAPPFEKRVRYFRAAAQKIEALEAQAEGMPDIGVYAIATGVYTKDECERKWAEIFNGPTP